MLNGILCSFKEGKLTLVATDGRRLAMVDLDVEIAAGQEASVIIPAKAINELQRLLKDEGDIEIRLGENQVAFELNGTLLVSKLIEGNYPNYRQVIPNEAKERIEMERETFLNAVRRVSLLTSEKSNSHQADLHEEQHRHRRQQPRDRRGQGIVAGQVRRQGFHHRVQPGVSDGSAARS